MKGLLKGISILACVIMLSSVASFGATKPMDYSKPIKITLKDKISNPDKEFKLLTKDKKEIPFIVNKVDDKTYVLAPLGTGEGITLSQTHPKNVAAIAQYQGEVFVQTKENLKKLSSLTGYPDRMYIMEGALGEPATPAPTSPQAEDSKSTGTDSSQTNVQVQGVDEADIIKVSGNYIYYSNYNKIYVAKATDGKLEQTRILDFGKDLNVSDMYVDNNSLIVIGTTYQNNKTYTKTIVYNMADPKSPKAYRSLSQEGLYSSSRKIDNQMYIISQAYIGQNPVMPMYIDSAVSPKEQMADIGSLRIFPPYYRDSIVTISSFAINNKAKAQSTNFVGNANDIYMSADSLYIAYIENNFIYGPFFREDIMISPPAVVSEPVAPSSNDESTAKLVPPSDEVIDVTPPDAYLDKTIIKRFSVDKGKITYVNEAKIVGNLINQFAMDESNGYFRVAYTRDETTGSEVAVFDKNMNQVGKVSNIAPGERIYSVRFMGDKLYLVTFKQVDPFFVIDMKNPRSPKMLGYLKIPGYSNYLHPYDENHIIGFGNDTKETQTGAVQNAGMKIAMFDVSDFTNPKQISNVVIGSNGTYSELMNNHKALLYNKAQSYFGFPVTVTEPPKAGEESWNYQTVFQGGYFYHVNKDFQFEFMGKTTHRTSAEWSWDQIDQIQRLAYIGNYVYSVSNKGISSNAVKDMKQVQMLQWTE